MSDPIEILLNELVGLEATNARAAEWVLAKEMSEDWSDENQASLDAWLSQSTSHVAAYWRITEAWRQAKRLKALRSPMRSHQVEDSTNSKSRALRLAAILVVGALGVGGVWLNGAGQPDTKTYTTPVGGHLQLALPDGSKIELNTDTQLALSTSGGLRSARLERGEAFFEIKHDELHPFNVSVGNHTVVDIGTKFVIRDDRSQISVALIEGKARFETKSQSAVAQATDLSPGDVVMAKAGSVSLSKQSIRDLNNRVAWRKGLLIFDNATLAEAASELNRYNDRKIVISDAKVARLTIGGTFYASDVPALLNTAQQIFGLRVHKRGNELVISR